MSDKSEIAASSREQEHYIVQRQNDLEKQIIEECNKQKQIAISEYEAFFEEVKAKGIKPAFQNNGIDAYSYTDDLYISVVRGVNISLVRLFQEQLYNIQLQQLVFSPKRQGQDVLYLIYKTSKIDRLSSVLPQKYVMPNNKLANTLTKDIVNVGEITLEVSRAGAKKLIETSCILTYEGDNVKLSGRQPYTEYDRNVYNAVSSLYVYGDPSHVVTPAMVYRAMTGLTDSEKPTAGQLAAVTRSLDKMRFIRARIDCTAELQARRITLNSKQINSGEIDTNLLMAKWVKVSAGGQQVKALCIVDVPILYEYAAAVKQVLTIPASTLDVKELNADGSIGARLPNTESRILIKGYLLRRIEGMKGKNGLNNPVIALYDYKRDGETHKGLYSIAGNTDPTRTEANRIRDDVEKMLAYWAATGYIKSFEAQTERKKITGYKIAV